MIIVSDMNISTLNTTSVPLTITSVGCPKSFALSQIRTPQTDTLSFRSIKHNIKITSKVSKSREIVTKKFVSKLIKAGAMLKLDGNKISAVYGERTKEIGKTGNISIRQMFLRYKKALCSGMVVNFNHMDPKKTYLGLSYANTLLAKAIRFFSKQYCKDKNIPNHAMAFVYENKKWWIYHASYKCPELGVYNTGTYRVPADEFIARMKKSNAKIEIYEMDIKSNKLKKNLDNGYGYGEVFNFIKAYFTNSNGKQNNSKGFTCSEYIARAIKKILKPWCITPAHLKAMALGKITSKI